MTAVRVLGVVIAAVDVALLAYGVPWQYVIVFGFIGVAVATAAYPAFRRAKTQAEILVIDCVALIVYAVLIVVISAATPD